MTTTRQVSSRSGPGFDDPVDRIGGKDATMRFSGGIPVAHLVGVIEPGGVPMRRDSAPFALPVFPEARISARESLGRKRMAHLPARLFAVVQLAVLLVASVPAVLAGKGSEEAPVVRASSLRTIEGEVTGVGETIAEGGSPVVAIRLTAGEETFHLLLAPRKALAGIEFDVEIGDSVRVRIFEPDENGDARVQKILNLTRGGVARLRGVRCGPLWDASGGWHGSPGGHHHGHGERARGRYRDRG